MQLDYEYIEDKEELMKQIDKCEGRVCTILK